jgi:two-component system CheB/CheR fusion protein
MRILLVDDNPDAVRVIENFLKALDHVVFSYTDAREALLWLKDVRPEVVLADLDMPGMDGYEFIRRLHAYTSFASVPVVCVTGTDATDEQIYAAGFAAVLRKPVTLADMLEMIETVKARTAAPAAEHAPNAPVGDTVTPSTETPREESVNQNIAPQ